MFYDPKHMAKSSLWGYYSDKVLVIIFQENVSFDHYFATYPNAANPPKEPRFKPLPNTPSVNGLTGALLTDNPNSAFPFRLDRSEAATTTTQPSNRPFMPDSWISSLSLQAQSIPAVTQIK